MSLNFEKQSTLNNSISSSALLAVSIWLKTALVFGILSIMGLLILSNEEVGIYILLLVPGSLLGSLPAFVLIFIGLILIIRFLPAYTSRLKCFVLLLTGILLIYSALAAAIAETIGENQYKWSWWIGITVALIFSVILGCYLTQFTINEVLSASYFPVHSSTNYTTHQTIMEQQVNVPAGDQPAASNSPILYKGIITGVLILLMMVPTLFISSLVQERKGRQQEIVREVSQRWAGTQKLSGLFLVLPYEVTYQNEKGKEMKARKELILLPEELKVGSELNPVVRKRSIYDVLLYRTDTKFTGHFALQLPKDISAEKVFWKDASVCLGLSDIRGIEEKVLVQIGEQQLELSPGLPNKEVLKTGLSAPLDLTGSKLSRLDFSTQVKLKGSEQLHFVPLAGNSTYAVTSSWPSPSFDGTSLPAEHLVNDSGFTANWSFSKANLPFGIILRDTEFNENDFSFGVSMVQPADQYSKTERSVKYAILFIGLTFSLFLVIELLQKKPVHPIQYVLIGIALSVFYTLLLSLSEFIAFDSAYAIAAIATIGLITLYANTHFRSWKTSSLFGLVLSCLYLFAFVLVRLEDTALLVGSIGLFIILALVMFGTRKINWYPASGNLAETKPVL